MQGSVAVIVPTYNRAYLISQAVESLISQTRKPSQIVVVDDGSTDNTREVVQRYGPLVEYVYQANEGKPAAVNRGLARVGADYTWVFDDDDVACPDAVERLAAVLDSDPSLGYSYGRYFMTETVPAGHREMGEVTGESHYPSTSSAGSLVALLEGCYLGGARLFVRTSAYSAVGGYDARFKRSQDYEMAIRIARRYPGEAISGPPTYFFRQHAGDRGHAGDRFAAERRQEKWFQYDSMLFDEIYQQMDLSEYLPPWLALDGHLRLAHLQRLSLLITHRVGGRLEEQLDLLAQLGINSSYSEVERAVIERLVRRLPGLWTPDSVALLDRVRSMSRSPAVAQFRNELAKAAVMYRVRQSGVRKSVGTIYRAARMYV